MPLSTDPVKRRRQMAHLAGKDKKLVGLMLDDPREIKVKLNRTLNSGDKSVIEDGEVVLNNIEMVEPPANYSIKRFFDSQPTIVQEGYAKTFGRDKKLINELIQKRLNHIKDDWIYAIPLLYENNDGERIQEDSFKFDWYAYRDRVKIMMIEPKKFVKLSGVDPRKFEHQRSRNLTRDYIKKGKPIPTPSLELNEKGDTVVKSEGFERMLGANDQEIKKVPVYIITKQPIESMSRLEKIKIDNLDFNKKVN